MLLEGRYTAEGIVQVAEALKVNKTLQSIEYTAEVKPVHCFMKWSCRQGPLTHTECVLWQY